MPVGEPFEYGSRKIRMSERKPYVGPPGKMQIALIREPTAENHMGLNTNTAIW
jgi:hypothetical protein